MLAQVDPDVRTSHDEPVDLLALHSDLPHLVDAVIEGVEAVVVGSVAREQVDLSLCEQGVPGVEVDRVPHRDDRC